MVQNFQQRLCTNQAITTGTSQTADQYQLTGSGRSRPGSYGVATAEGARDIGGGSEPLFLRFRVTESFNQANTLLEVVPTIASTIDMTAADAIEYHRKRILGVLLIAGATWHLPLGPLSAAEVLASNGLPIWPIPLAFIGAKFIVTGTAFSTGRVTCDITTHIAPDALVGPTGAIIPPKIPIAGW